MSKLSEQLVKILSVIEYLVIIKDMADTGKLVRVNQGQVLDGYSELASYRKGVAELAEVLEEGEKNEQTSK